MFFDLLGVYICSFGLFINAYVHEDFNSYGTFEGDLKEVIGDGCAIKIEVR